MAIQYSHLCAEYEIYIPHTIERTQRTITQTLQHTKCLQIIGKWIAHSHKRTHWRIHTITHTQTHTHSGSNWACWIASTPYAKHKRRTNKHIDTLRTSKTSIRLNLRIAKWKTHIVMHCAMVYVRCTYTY